MTTSIFVHDHFFKMLCAITIALALPQAPEPHVLKAADACPTGANTVAGYESYFTESHADPTIETPFGSPADKAGGCACR